MKKVKITFWIIVFGFLALVIFQNKDFFLAENSLNINLYFAQYQTATTFNAVLFMGFFLSGILISYIISLFDKYKTGKTIKELNAKQATFLDTINGLKKEVEALKTAPPVPESEVAVENSSAENV